MELTKEDQEKIGRLQLFEQHLQSLLLQKQQFQTQLLEVESAISEIATAEQAYKIIGNIMVEGRKEELEKELKQKKEVAELRIKSMEKQETQIREKAKMLQEEVVKNLKK